jgi:hypothetical protein
VHAPSAHGVLTFWPSGKEGLPANANDDFHWVSFPSWLWGAAAAAPLAFAENGGVQAASGFAGTRKATRSARPFAQSRLPLWVEALAARRGKVTPYQCERQRGKVREGALPVGGDKRASAVGSGRLRLAPGPSKTRRGFCIAIAIPDCSSPYRRSNVTCKRELIFGD